MSLLGLDPVPRIGCVPYLNARPLLEGIQSEVRKEHPAKLWETYKTSQLDAALVSSIDVFSEIHPCVVDGVSIHSKGEVYSVILRYSGELRDIKKVALDPASHTSNALLRVLLEEFHDIHPEYVRYESDSRGEMPRIVIGDAAIEERKRPGSPEQASGSFLDLGAEWYRQTGLPFVFAVWVLRSEFPKKKELAQGLRLSKEQGIKRIHQIAAGERDPAFALEYLTRHIRYGLGDEEKSGLELFKTYLIKMKILPFRDQEIIYH